MLLGGDKEATIPETVFSVQGTTTASSIMQRAYHPEGRGVRYRGHPRVSTLVGSTDQLVWSPSDWEEVTM